MAAAGDEQSSAAAGPNLSDEQIKLLDDALRPLPRSLTAEAEEAQLIEHALANAPALFAAAKKEWEALVAAKRLRREANRPLPRALRNIQAFLPNAEGGQRLTVIGVLLLLTALAATAPGIAQLRPIAIFLMVGGAFVTALPRLSRVPFRALRLRMDIDLRWAQARLAGAGPFYRILGRLFATAGVMALVASSQALGGRALLWTGAGFCGVGLNLIVLSRLLRFLGYGLLPLDHAGATVRWEAAKQLLQDRLRTEGQMLIREKLNRDEVRPYETELSFKDHSGLGEIDDPRREIPTGARRQLLHKMARLPGGTIGLAGPRGAGKTTLMRSICGAPSTRVKTGPPLAFIVDAPVRYESRDFVLYLFARLCSEIVGLDRVREMRGSDRPFGYPAGGSTRFLGDSRWLFGVGLMSAGLTLLFLALIGVDDISSPFATGAVLLFVGYFAIAFQALGERNRKRHLLGTEQADASEGDLALLDLAMLRLRQIWFQQSFSSGWSGGFKVPVGESGFSGSADLAEQQLSLPDIVALFREFLTQVAARREVRIGIDELDKMDDEAARAFLNDIKVIFRIQDCFFLLSISEDAMSVFERRGLPIRDVFDSSFDDVQYVPHLRFSDSRKLLERRVVDLPVPFAGLLHCMSGGLPRDLVRAARELVDVPEKPPSPRLRGCFCAARWRRRWKRRGSWLVASSSKSTPRS